ncbi:hypothetical protein RF11_02423 [Thelohanellus kitauei]|uniref:Uncharacterized protein n=1 Tax=Thelohanellus kitauei TaxID=669202 RepID=A0A0C2IMZ9_THEKT|nr:hypothetical protein RF11_02423 [Thelohanellus kitauei]
MDTTSNNNELKSSLSGIYAVPFLKCLLKKHISEAAITGPQKAKLLENIISVDDNDCECKSESEFNNLQTESGPEVPRCVPKVRDPSHQNSGQPTNVQSDKPTWFIVIVALLVVTFIGASAAVLALRFLFNYGHGNEVEC